AGTVGERIGAGRWGPRGLRAAPVRTRGDGYGCRTRGRGRRRRAPVRPALAASTYRGGAGPPGGTGGFRCTAVGRARTGCRSGTAGTGGAAPGDRGTGTGAAHRLHSAS